MKDRSLFSDLPEIASVMGVSRDALRERMLSLVEAGTLEMIPGRGPGTGVRSTPTAIVAVVLAQVALMRPTELAACVGNAPRQRKPRGKNQKAAANRSAQREAA